MHLMLHWPVSSSSLIIAIAEIVIVGRQADEDHPKARV
jgi:hypothetical protein